MNNGSALRAMIDGMRPAHWIKNIFVFAAMPFGEKLFFKDAWLMCGGVFFIFCGLASAVYLINDVRDRDRDRLHPEKKKRAVASGRLGVSAAVAGSIILFALSIAGAYYIDMQIMVRFPVITFCAALYVVSNIFYTFWIKEVAIVDIIFISAGFVIRVVAGALAIQVPISPWLVICTFMLSLFIGTTKRRSEMRAYSSGVAEKVRNANAFYTPERLEHILAVTASLAIMSYSLYCVSLQTQERIGSIHMVWTIPFVVYGVFRYYCLSLTSASDDTIEILLKDRVIWITGILWLISAVLVIYLSGIDPLPA
jgi:4-hydroxybenzoate polyprenyltransferase